MKMDLGKFDHTIGNGQNLNKNGLKLMLNTITLIMINDL